MIENKKIRELDIVHKIYQEKDYNILFSEKPDFILNKKRSKRRFGIEVCELYINEANARLINDQDYIKNVLANKIHKDDIGLIKPCMLYIKNIDDEKYIPLGNFVKKKSSSYDEYEQALIELINKKCRKFLAYKKLEYCELFIYDRENYFNSKLMPSMELLEKSEKIKQTVDNSPFVRVYIFTKCQNKDCLLIMGDIYSGPLGDKIASKK